MPDFRLITVNTPDIISFDWLQLPGGQLDETQQLASAVLIALNTDALADVNDVLPDPRDSNRRGWWGDLDAEKIWNGWPIGSKLWLLSRAKILGPDADEGSTLVRVDSYIRMALQPFIDAGICTRVDVSIAVEKINGVDARIVATILIFRGPKPAIRLEYQPLWTEIANNAQVDTQSTGTLPPPNIGGLDFTDPTDSGFIGALV